MARRGSGHDSVTNHKWEEDMPNWKKVITSGSDAKLNNIDVTSTGSFDRVEANTIDLDRLSLTSTQTTVPPLQLTANSLQDGVGALRIDGSQADIYLNPSTATHTTVTFAVNNDQRLAFGMDDASDFYITRRTGGTWYDNTFVLSRDTGKLSLGYGLVVTGSITGSDITIDDWGSVSASLASLDASVYGDSDVTDHINTLGVVSGSSQITISNTIGYTTFSSSIASDIAAIDSNVTLQDATDNGNTTTNSITTTNSVFASTFTGSLLRLDENGTGMRMTNVGAFENAGGVFHIFSNGDLRLSTNGSGAGATAVTFDQTTKNADFIGEISSSDVNIDGWGSISSSLASLDASTYNDSDVTAHINTLNVHSGSHLGTATTDDLPEGSTNLYYTDTRVKTKLNTENVISGSSQVDINSTSGTLTTLGTVTSGDISAILPSGVVSGSVTSPSQGTLSINGNNIDLGIQVGDSPTFTDLTLTGNLTVEGTRTELQVTELNVEDKNITVASGAADSAAADGAGLTIDGANESLTWNHANSRFQFSDDLRVDGLLNIGSVSNAGTDTDKFLVLDSNGNVDFRTGTEVRSDIGAASTANLSGASTELAFFSSTTEVTSSIRTKITENIATGNVLIHQGQLNVINDPTNTGNSAMQIIVGSGSSNDVSNPQYDSFLSMEHEGGNGTMVALRANGVAPTAAQIRMRTDVNDAYSIGRLINPYGANTLRIKPTVIAEGGLSITGSLTISGSNTFRNIGPAQFSGSVNIRTSDQVQATTDTDKFVVLDGKQLKYRSGAQVYDDIGVTSLSSSIAADIAALDTSAGGGTIYTSNGNLSGDRTINGASNSLSFNNLEFFAINNSVISLEAGPAIYLNSLPAATGSALNNSLYLDTVSGELKYASAATLSSITANGASTTNTIRAGGLLVTGSVIISGSNTLINQGPAEFSGSVKLNTSDQVQATTDTDKFLVLDGDQIKYRSGAQVRSDIGAASSGVTLQAVTDNGSSTTNSIVMANFTVSNPTNNNAGSDKILVLDGSNRSKIRTRDQLRDDIGALQASKTPQMVVTSAEVLDEATTDVFIPFSGINIFPESNTNTYAKFYAPYDGHIKEIIVHPHESATAGNCTITPTIDGTATTGVQASISGTAGTSTTFSFGVAGYSFSDGDDIHLRFDREANDRSKGFGFTIVFIMDATS